MAINDNLKTSQNSPLRQSSTVVQKVMIGHVDCFVNSKTKNTPFIIGKRYSIQELDLTDDFSNMGYVADETPFVALAENPILWTGNTEAFFHDDNVNIIINDIDPNIEIYSLYNDKIEFKLTNNGFVADKTYPDMNGLQTVEVIDENTIRTQTGESFFKIEVYE